MKYTIDDLRGKYVKVGTPECEIFMNACDMLGIRWADGESTRNKHQDKECISLNHHATFLSFSNLIYYQHINGWDMFVPKTDAATQRVDWSKAPKEATHALRYVDGDIAFAVLVGDRHRTIDRLSDYFIVADKLWQVIEARPVTDEIDNTVTQRGERYQYTPSDLRGKYVEVGTKACEVFLDLCERFDIKWQDGKPVRKYEIKSTCIAVDIKHCRLFEAPYGIDILNSYTPFILVGVPVTDDINDTVTQRGERYGLFADGVKYERTLVGLCGTHVKTDVYRVLDAFNTGDPILDHLIKKALCAGSRGHKDKLTDYRNIVESAEKALKLLEQKQNGN